MQFLMLPKFAQAKFPHFAEVNTINQILTQAPYQPTFRIDATRSQAGTEQE